MAAINQSRVWLGTVAGGVVWIIWSSLINILILAPQYMAAQNAGFLLKKPRYSFFVVVWFVALFLLTHIIARLYAWVRGTLGPGPKTALTVGFLVGFAAGFPVNFSITAWAPFDRVIPLWWTLDLWVGAILAALVAGWLYRD